MFYPLQEETMHPLLALLNVYSVKCEAYFFGAFSYSIGELIALKSCFSK